MTELTLASLRFVAPSPSLLYCVGFHGAIQLAFAGNFGWRIVLGDKVSPMRYASRDEAARALANAMGVLQ